MEKVTDNLNFFANMLLLVVVYEIFNCKLLLLRMTSFQHLHKSFVLYLIRYAENRH